MKTVIFITCILFFQFIEGFAQEYENMFYNEFEEESFNSLIDDVSCCDAIISTLVATNPQRDKSDYESIKKRINTTISQIKNEIGNSKNIKKQAKIIFNTVHDEYLNVYAINTLFDEIFNSGEYNCVTASALYAIILEALEIDYSIRHLPTHVYVTINSNEEEIVLETTDPVAGLYQINKENYIKAIGQMKLINNDLLNENSITDIYDEYLLEGEKKITLKELVGDHYYNFAALKLEFKAYDEALVLLEKSIQLQESELAKQIQTFANMMLTTIHGNSEIDHYPPVIRLIKDDDFNQLGSKELLYSFEEMADDLLVNNYQQDKYDTIKDYVINELRALDSELLTDILQIHFFFNAKHNAYSANKAKALIYLDSAYVNRPNDIHIHGLLMDALINKIENSRSKDVEELKSMAAEYKEQYPFLKDKIQFETLELSLICFQLQMTFYDDEEEVGFKIFEEFNKKLDLLSEHNELVRHYIGIAYGSISALYIRRSEYDKGKQWLIDGMKLAPESEELQRKMAAFEDYELKYKD